MTARRWLAVLALVATPHAAGAGSHEVPFQQIAGLVTVDPAGRACLSIANARLARGTSVTLVVVPPRTPPIVTIETERGVVGDALSAPCSSASDEPHHAFYRVTREDGSGVPRGHVYVAIVGAVAVRAVVGRVTTDLGRAGSVYELDACASRDGVHFAIRTAGQRRWHRYHYVGYDLEPTCED